MTASPTPRRAALAFVFVTALLDVLALGIVIPVLPDLVKGFVGGDNAQAAHMVGLFGTLFAAMQFLFSPLIGALSDRFGRRPILLVSCFGLGVDYLLMAVAPSLGWLVVGRIVSGITAASFTTASAYIADVTPAEKRAGAFGMLGAAFGLGFIVGPAAGGLLGGIEPRLPFWVAGGLSLLNACYGLFVLPESLPADRRGAFSWRRANPLGAFALLRGAPGLLGLGGIVWLYYLAHEVLNNTFVIYVNDRYGWGPESVGLTLAGVGVCSTVVQGGLVGRVVKRLGARRTMMVGLVAGAAGFTTFGASPVGAGLLCGIPLVALWGMVGPSAQSMMSAQVAATEQGLLQGTLVSIRGITGMIGPLLFTSVLADSVGPFAMLPQGSPFMLAAVLLVAALALAFVVTRPQRAMA
ncbi:TCR/Tet family MFS transporter [Nitrospirillum amazonense]|uniref:DHA1 family tetracycline resistance protein-like MFS transporter n=1 Tax=Nitrospirillum amazonense TaxID=28077 RepID=A0A560KA24_9PROT|nr:TCR/Tet family MFS transporter [Nitrospirillum amazonense]MDG3441452.1 TCR/Tet family MFS transporter [Nitrospirillum amazonense]TWB80056.1 DHA1 family tetracycline resistance protein-like MFS transporter [Nitrospirillum amazonense]